MVYLQGSNRYLNLKFITLHMSNLSKYIFCPMKLSASFDSVIFCGHHIHGDTNFTLENIFNI